MLGFWVRIGVFCFAGLAFGEGMTTRRGGGTEELAFGGKRAETTDRLILTNLLGNYLKDDPS